MKRFFLTAGVLLLAGAGWAGARQPRVVPVVEMRNGYLLGGTVNGQWRNVEAVRRLLRGGERYRVYGGGRLLGQAAGRRPESIGVPCEETYAVELAPKPAGAAIAVGGTGNAVPRPVTRLDPAGPVYREAVRQLLVRKGIRNPVVQITGLARVDLEGDGRDEVIVSARRGRVDRGIRVEAGEYAVLFVRRVIDETVRTVILEEQYHPRASDQQILNDYALAGVYDLDGDGVYEIVMHGSYYEGEWTTVYRQAGTTKRELLRTGCGV